MAISASRYAQSVQPETMQQLTVLLVVVTCVAWAGMDPNFLTRGLGYESVHNVRGASSYYEVPFRICSS